MSNENIFLPISKSPQLSFSNPEIIGKKIQDKSINQNINKIEKTKKKNDTYEIIDNIKFYCIYPIDNFVNLWESTVKDIITCIGFAVNEPKYVTVLTNFLVHNIFLSADAIIKSKFKSILKIMNLTQIKEKKSDKSRDNREKIKEKIFQDILPFFQKYYAQSFYIGKETLDVIKSNMVDLVEKGENNEDEYFIRFIEEINEGNLDKLIVNFFEISVYMLLNSPSLTFICDQEINNKITNKNVLSLYNYDYLNYDESEHINILDNEQNFDKDTTSLQILSQPMIKGQIPLKKTRIPVILINDIVSKSIDINLKNLVNKHYQKFRSFNLKESPNRHEKKSFDVHSKTQYMNLIDISTTPFQQMARSYDNKISDNSNDNENEVNDNANNYDNKTEIGEKKKESFNINKYIINKKYTGNNNNNSGINTSNNYHSNNSNNNIDNRNNYKNDNNNNLSISNNMNNTISNNNINTNDSQSTLNFYQDSVNFNHIKTVKPKERSNKLLLSTTPKINNFAENITENIPISNVVNNKIDLSGKFRKISISEEKRKNNIGKKSIDNYLKFNYNSCDDNVDNVDDINILIQNHKNNQRNYVINTIEENRENLDSITLTNDNNFISDDEIEKENNALEIEDIGKKVKNNSSSMLGKINANKNILELHVNERKTSEQTKDNKDNFRNINDDDDQDISELKEKNNHMISHKNIIKQSKEMDQKNILLDLQNNNGYQHLIQGHSSLPIKAKKLISQNNLEKSDIIEKNNEKFIKFNDKNNDKYKKIDKNIDKNTVIRKSNLVKNKKVKLKKNDSENSRDTASDNSCIVLGQSKSSFSDGFNRNSTEVNAKINKMNIDSKLALINKNEHYQANTYVTQQKNIKNIVSNNSLNQVNINPINYNDNLKHHIKANLTSNNFNLSQNIPTKKIDINNNNNSILKSNKNKASFIKKIYENKDTNKDINYTMQNNDAQIYNLISGIESKNNERKQAKYKKVNNNKNNIQTGKSNRHTSPDTYIYNKNNCQQTPGFIISNNNTILSKYSTKISIGGNI